MVGLVTGIGLTAAGAITAASVALGVGAAGVAVEAGTAIAGAVSGSPAKTAEGLAQQTAGEQQYYNSLLANLVNNPSSVSQLPGFQFELSTGANAVADAMGPTGHLGSGNEAAALEQFGTGLASSFYGQQTSLLASLSGLTAASSPAQDINAATGANAQSSQTLSQLLNTLGFFGKLSSGTGAPAGTPASSGAPMEVQPAGVDMPY